ncbi:MAG: hypothetical protein NZM35_03200 [Chitinophagales bacterium]|nr:hypothetical protein [Chitinophagales bacterium]MDW8418688.1 hypothetical protein [Chitinophagales bacterium]
MKLTTPMLRPCIFLLLIIVLFTGCKNKTVSTQANLIPLRHAVADSLNGTWMPEEYLLTVEQTKSIWKARDVNFSFFTFWLDKENLMSDSAILSGATEHEGGYLAYLQYDSTTGRFINNLNTGTGEPYIDEPFELRLIDSNRLEIFFTNSNTREVYRRVKDAQYALSSALIAGAYEDLSDHTVVVFHPDGKVESGWKEDHYALIFDFMEGIDFDAIELYNENESSSEFLNNLYHFAFSGDTLRLYSASDPLGTFQYQISNKPYKVLVRQRAL